MITHYPRNLTGRDYAVGDIHGCFALLEQRLIELGFEPRCDRLFSVGDLVDRGPDSAACLTWLSKPWFHAVRGNHEAMAIAYARGELERRMVRANGGAWLIALPPSEQARFAAAFERLPIALEVDTVAGLVGLVHAECPFEDWATLRAALGGTGTTTAAAPRQPGNAAASGSPGNSASNTNGANRINSPDDATELRDIEDLCLWSRRRIHGALSTRVAGVHAVLVGHTPVPSITALGNVMYIDTGAGYRNGRISVLPLDAIGT